MELYVVFYASVDSGPFETLGYRSHIRTDPILVTFLVIKIPPPPPDPVSRRVSVSASESRRFHYRREEDQRKMKMEEGCDDGC
jgi:hypothetical protein